MGRPPLQQPKYKCVCCGKEYENIKGHFYVSASPANKETGYLSTCNSCVQKIYTELTKKYENEHEALRRTCMMFDLCFSEKLFQLSEKRNLNSNRMGKYMSYYNMYQYHMKEQTFEDTIEEEKSQKALEDVQSQYEDEVETEEDTDAIDLEPLKKKWGLGYQAPHEYLALEDHYKMLSSKLDDDDVVQQLLIMDLCDIKIQEVRCRIRGDNKGMKEFKQLYQTTLGTANLKPKDNKVQNSELNKSISIDAEFIERYVPADVYLDKDLFRDIDGFEFDEYKARFIDRPQNNFVNETNIMDAEYSVIDGDDDE